MTALTVVTATPSGEALEVRDLLGQWVATGLIEPLLWVDAIHSEGPDSGRMGVWLGESGPQEVSVLVKAGDAPYSLVRVIGIGLLAQDGVAPSLVGPDATVRLLAGARPANQTLRTVNILVPVTGVREVAAGWVRRNWDVNLVASWEDRISSEHGDQQVHHPGNLVAHAALAVATAAGAWVTMKEGPFDGRLVAQTGERAQILVGRAFGRVIRAEALVDEVTRQLMGAAPQTRVGPTGATPARDGQRITARLSEDFSTLADNGALQFRPRQPDPPAPLKFVSFRAAFGMMFRFIWDRLRRMPFDVVARWDDKVRRGLVSWAQDKTFGPGSEYAVRVAGRAAASDAESRELPADAARDERELAESVLEQMDQRPTPPSAPRLWEALRSVCFGLVDGGDMPAELKPPQDGSRREVLVDLRLVVAEPDEPPIKLEAVDTSVGPFDPHQARKVGSWIEAERVVAQGNEDVDRVALLDQDTAALGAWVETQEPAFLWRLGYLLSEQIDEAAASFRQHCAVVAAGTVPMDQNAVIGARVRLRRAWLLWSVLLVLLVLIGLASGIAAMGPLVILGASVGLTTVWLLGFVWSYLRYQREMFRLQHQADQRISQFAEALKGAEHDAGELVRLTSLYEQLRDWSEIVAWLVHYPGGRTPAQSTEGVSQTIVKAPAALKVGIGQPSSAMLTSAAARVARHAFQAGWLQNLYARYRESSMQTLKFLNGLDGSAPDPDPDRDLSVPPARMALLRDVAEPSFTRAWRSELRAQVIAVLSEVDPEQIFASVATADSSGSPSKSEGVDEFLAGLLPPAGSEGAFSDSMWTPAARQARRGKVDSSMFWGPAILHARPTVDTLTHCATHAAVNAAKPFTLEAVRLDLSDVATVEEMDFLVQGLDTEHESPTAAGAAIPHDVG